MGRMNGLQSLEACFTDAVVWHSRTPFVVKKWSLLSAQYLNGTFGVFVLRLCFISLI